MQVIEKTKEDVTIKISKDELSSIIDTCKCHGCWIENMTTDLFDRLKDAYK